MLSRIVFFLLPFALTLPTSFGEGIDTEAGLKLIEAEENKLHSLRWKFDFEQWRTKSGSLKKQPEHVAGEVICDLEKHRYHMHGVETLRWQGGKSDYLSSRFGMAFDGTRYQDWHHVWHGTQPPPPIIDRAGGITQGVDINSVKVDAQHTWPSGKIGPRESPGKGFAVYSNASGLQYIGPLFHSRTETGGVQHVSQFLREQKSNGSAIQMTRDGEFLTVSTSNAGSETIKLRIDLLHYAAICSAEWLSGDKTSRRYEVQYKKVGNGNVVPTECTETHPFDGMKETIRFSDFEWNPKIDDLTFQLRMPPGTYLTDDFTGVSSNISK